MKKSILSFNEFILESNNFNLNEQEVAKKLELPEGVIYNSTSKKPKKGNFYVDISNDSVKISYNPNDSKISSVEFNKDKDSDGGFSSVVSINTKKDEIKREKSVSDTKANAGNLLLDFIYHSGQFGDDSNSNFINTLSKILRVISISENYKQKTTQSFKSFMAGIYDNYNKGNMFAGVDEKNKTSKMKSVSEDFKKEMEKTIKEYSTKKA